MNQHRSALNILFYLVCFGIVYGSLFPFQFALAPDRAVVDHFLVSWRTVSGTGDILGNIALFMPFGLLLGPLIGSMFCEFVFAKKEVRPATVSGVGSVLGTMAGLVVKVVVGVMMIIWFVVDVIWI